MSNIDTSVQADQLRQTMRYWATGVTVVTAAHDGERHGMTVNSFTSLSLSPPLVMVSLEQHTRTHALVQHSGAYGVTLLHVSQQTISDRFAGRDTETVDRFEALTTFTLESGSPLIEGGLAYLDCRVVDTYQAGTHTLFIARLLAAQDGQADQYAHPLLYFNRQYRNIS